MQMAKKSRGARGVGIEDVARAAGVSITTVSHALNNRGHVSERTREKVREVAERMGYAPNRIASALRSQRSHILGFVSDDIATTPFAGRVVLGAQDAAADRDQLLVVVNSNNDAAIEAKQISALLAAQVDAVVFARMFHRDTELPSSLRGVPTVLVDTVDRGGVIPSVVPDEDQIARLAAQTLWDAGHRRIAHVSVTTPGPGADGRADGYRGFMAEAGLEPAIAAVAGRGNAEAGRTAFTELLGRGGARPTAVFSFNDQMAMGVFQAAYFAGIRIPDQLSVVGVDDFEPIAAEMLPALTTVALPHYEMGRWAVDSALAMLDGDEWDGPIQTRLPGRLVVRDSVAPPTA